MSDEKYTVGQLISFLKKLKISTIAIVVTVVTTYSTLLFLLGGIAIIKKSGIDLKRPFVMKLEIDKCITDKARNKTGTSLTLADLTLQDYPYDSVKDIRRMVIIQDKGDVDINVIGLIQTKIVEVNRVSELFKKLVGSIDSIFTTALYADNFEWHGHNNSKNYVQQFKDRNHVLRTYDNGSQLEFKFDANGKALPNSFKWVTIIPKEDKKNNK